MTTAIPVVDEAHARARLDALVCEHGLPFQRAYWLAYDAEFLAVCTTAPPFTLTAQVPTRADIAVWAAFLGVEPTTDHTIHEYDDGRWCAVWTEAARLSDWLPGGVRLAVVHTEARWIERGLRGNLTDARRYLADLTPAQHTELTLKLVLLLAANEEIAEEKAATALLTPDCPSLPAGVEGYVLPGVHTNAVKP